MKCDNKHDRKENPGECDNCHANIDVDLKRLYSYGPGHQIEWLCAYCANMASYKENKDLCAAMNVLERRLRLDKGK